MDKQYHVAVLCAVHHSIVELIANAKLKTKHSSYVQTLTYCGCKPLKQIPSVGWLCPALELGKKSPDI